MLFFRRCLSFGLLCHLHTHSSQLAYMSLLLSTVILLVTAPAYNSLSATSSIVKGAQHHYSSDRNVGYQTMLSHVTSFSCVLFSACSTCFASNASARVFSANASFLRPRTFFFALFCATNLIRTPLPINVFLCVPSVLRVLKTSLSILRAAFFHLMHSSPTCSSCGMLFFLPACLHNSKLPLVHFFLLHSLCLSLQPELCSPPSDNLLHVHFLLLLPSSSSSCSHCPCE